MGDESESQVDFVMAYTFALRRSWFTENSYLINRGNQMAVTLNDTANCINFFQEAILRTLRYWEEHAALKDYDMPRLDRERETILNIIGRALEFEPAWPILKQLLIAFASYMERRGHWEAWRGVMEKAVVVARQVNDLEGEITLTAFLARLAQRQSLSQDVVRFYRRVIQLAKHTGNRYEEARACSNLGYYYIDEGYWWRSEVLSCHALNVFEELNSDHGQAHTCNHLGLLYTRQNRWHEARENLDNARQILHANQDNHSLILVYINLGSLYIELNDQILALENLENAYRLAQTTGEMPYIARIWNNMAIVYRQNRDWLKAERYARKAEDYFKEFSDVQQLANVWHNLGLILHGRGEKLQADEFFRKSLKMHQTLNNQTAEKEVKASIERCSNSDRG